MRNLIGTLQQDNGTCLNNLNVMLFEIHSPQTGEVFHSGLFNIPKERSIHPDLFTLVLSDKRSAEILIKSSILSGNNRAVFFSVLGEFY
jgi:hypothetical protein